MLKKIIPIVQNTRRNLENLGEEDSSRASPDAEKIWEDFKTAAEKTVPKELGGGIILSLGHILWTQAFYSLIIFCHVV